MSERNGFRDMIDILWPAIVLIAALVAIVVVVEMNQLPSGTVYSKAHIPAHTESHCMMVGKILMPQTRFVPERWVLHIRSGRSTRSVDVPKSVYDATSLDSHYEVSQ